MELNGNHAVGYATGSFQAKVKKKNNWRLQSAWWGPTKLTRNQRRALENSVKRGGAVAPAASFAIAYRPTWILAAAPNNLAHPARGHNH